MQTQENAKPKRSFCFWLAAFAAVMVFGWSATKPAAIGCSQSELTTIPDAQFVPQAVAAAQQGEPEKLVCLTFDDGPSKNTPKVLDTLAKRGVPATFFVIAAENNEKFLPTIADEVAAGHQIALHSASHDYKKIYQSPKAFWEDIDLLKEKINPYVDVNSINCLRFPGGSTNTVSHKYGGGDIMKTLKKQAEEKGYHWVDWNVCAEDAVGGHPSAEQIYSNVINEVNGQKICVVLMHDTAATGSTVEALPAIIDWFQNEGYHFCTVEDMLAARP